MPPSPGRGCARGIKQKTRRGKIRLNNIRVVREEKLKYESRCEEGRSNRRVCSSMHSARILASIVHPASMASPHRIALDPTGRHCTVLYLLRAPHRAHDMGAERRQFAERQFRNARDRVGGVGGEEAAGAGQLRHLRRRGKEDARKREGRYKRRVTIKDQARHGAIGAQKIEDTTIRSETDIVN